MRDPPTNRQKAVTGKMLKDLLKLAQFGRRETKHAIDLTIGAFFFAMRSCEFSLTKRRGRTVPLELGHITFRDANSNLVAQTDPELVERARYVTVYFVDQKNGIKGDRRTQQKTGLELCPVVSWANVCRRVRELVPEANEETKVYTVTSEEGLRIDISSKRIALLLKNLCKVFGKANGYGVEHNEIGTRSIRSGAAMALFLMDHSIEKIKILGRWSSDAFMVYIRPQVLEWTNLMAKDMAKTEGFKDLAEGARTRRGQVEPRTHREHIRMPRFYVSS